MKAIPENGMRYSATSVALPTCTPEVLSPTSPRATGSSRSSTSDVVIVDAKTRPGDACGPDRAKAGLGRFVGRVHVGASLHRGTTPLAPASGEGTFRSRAAG